VLFVFSFFLSSCVSSLSALHYTAVERLVGAGHHPTGGHSAGIIIIIIIINEYYLGAVKSQELLEQLTRLT